MFASLFEANDLFFQCFQLRHILKNESFDLFSISGFNSLSFIVHRCDGFSNLVIEVNAVLGALDTEMAHFFPLEDLVLEVLHELVEHKVVV